MTSRRRPGGRALIAVLAFGFVVAATVGSGTSAGAAGDRNARPPAPPQPNIILILTDDQRWDTMNAMPQTQELLGDQGVTFTQAMVTNSLCCPSRASIFTGNYTHTHGVWRNNPPYGVDIFDPSSTIATWLDDAGYDTAMIGKYLNRYRGQVPVAGWDRFVARKYGLHEEDTAKYYNYTLLVDGKNVDYGRDKRDYFTTVLSEYARDFVRTSENPYFLYLALSAPHEPAIPARQDRGGYQDIPRWRPASFNEVDVSDKPQWLRDVPRLNHKQIDANDKLREHMLETLTSADRTVGQLVRLVARRGELANTVFLFTSDNGYAWGEHRWATKKIPYEEAIRVPLVMRYDPVVADPGSTDDAVVANIDFAPTLAELAGLTPPATDGESLVPLLDGTQPPGSWREGVAVEHLSDDQMPSYCGIRTDGWMYVWYGTAEEELYDLDADPLELDNLAGSPGLAATQAHLREMAKTTCQPTPPDPFWTPIP